MYTKEQIKDFVLGNEGVLAPQIYFVQVPNEFIRNENIDIKEKMLYIYLLSFASGRYNAYPGLARMQSELGITKKTIIKILKSLEDKEGIYIINRVYKNNINKKGTNLYYLSEIDNQTGSFRKGSLDIIRGMYPNKMCIIQ